MKNLDWTLLRAFHATATEGSLSAAARKLGLTQPTLSRQVAELEAHLSIRLFLRKGKRLHLTAQGQALLAHARDMDRAASDLALAATGQANTLSGEVTLSLTDVFAAWIMPPIVRQILAVAPGITLRLRVTDAKSDLHRQEADIALRHGPPDQPGLLGRQLPDSTAHAYAAPGWIARHGRPSTAEDLAQAGLIGVEDAATFARQLAAFGIPLSADTIRITADTGVAMWEMARQGIAPALMLDEIAARFPEMERIWPPGLAPIRAPLWVVLHRDIAEAPRIALVRDILTEALIQR